MSDFLRGCEFLPVSLSTTVCSFGSDCAFPRTASASFNFDTAGTTEDDCGVTLVTLVVAPTDWGFCTAACLWAVAFCNLSNSRVLVGFQSLDACLQQLLLRLRLCLLLRRLLYRNTSRVLTLLLCRDPSLFLGRMWCRNGSQSRGLIPALRLEPFAVLRPERSVGPRLEPSVQPRLGYAVRLRHEPLSLSRGLGLSAGPRHEPVPGLSAALELVPVAGPQHEPVPGPSVALELVPVAGPSAGPQHGPVPGLSAARLGFLCLLLGLLLRLSLCLLLRLLLG